MSSSIPSRWSSVNESRSVLDSVAESRNKPLFNRFHCFIRNTEGSHVVINAFVTRKIYVRESTLRPSVINHWGKFKRGVFGIIARRWNNRHENNVLFTVSLLNMKYLYYYWTMFLKLRSFGGIFWIEVSDLKLMTVLSIDLSDNMPNDIIEKFQSYNYFCWYCVISNLKLQQNQSFEQAFEFQTNSNMIDSISKIGILCIPFIRMVSNLITCVDI